MTLWNHTLLCEKVEGTASYRVILFDRDLDTGADSVMDILESDSIPLLSTYYSHLINDTNRSFKLGEKHNNVNLGRAVKMETKIKKVLESL